MTGFEVDVRALREAALQDAERAFREATTTKERHYARLALQRIRRQLNAQEEEA